MPAPLRLICSLLLALLCGRAGAETVSIDAATTVRSNAANPIGLNLNYLMDAESKRPAAKTRTLDAALGDMQARFLRYPGGEKSDNYLWSTAAGSTAPITRSDAVPSPLRPRVVTTAAWPGGDANFVDGSGAFTTAVLDFDAFMALCQAHACEAVVVVAYDNAREITGNASSPTLAQLVESAAAWVKYANVTRGYGVKYWEIGNESWFRSGQTASIYASHLALYASAMRAVDPSIRIGAHGQGSAWWNTVMSDAAASCDWLAVHDYPTYQWTAGYDTFRLSARDLTAETDVAIAAIGARPHSIGITETNVIDWFSGGWTNVNDLGHALVHFDLIGQQLLKPKVAFTQCWNSRWINNVAYAAGTGANSVSNPGFESDLSGWTGSGGSISTTTVHGGAKALQVAGGGYHQAAIAMVAGRTYELSGWSRTSSTSIWSGYGVDCFNAGGTKIASFGVTTKSTSAWSQGGRAFTVPAGTVSAVIWVYAGAGSVTTYFDDLLVSDTVRPEINDALTPGNDYQPIGRVLAIWGQYMPERLVKTTNSASVIAYAGTAAAPGQPLLVWLCNKQTADVPLSLAISGFTLGGSASRWTFAGASPGDFAPTWTADADLPITASPIALTLPRLSITVLRIAAGGGNSAPTIPTAAAAAPTLLVLP